jgi:L-lactate dehydrogenase complex protein LldG
MSSRTQILEALRSHARQRLPSAQPPPAEYLPVTNLGDEPLISRFTKEVERLTGKIYVLTEAQAVVDTVLTILGVDQAVLTWKNLPLPELAPALAQRGIELIEPTADRSPGYQSLASIRVGITGVDAAFATTGTLALASVPGQGRIPSLLPPVHVALLHRERLYPTMEAWLKHEGATTLGESRSVAFITGPSRTSDIEMQTILGVHGPKEVHVLIYG